jgi:hypothetical protein
VLPVSKCKPIHDSSKLHQLTLSSALFIASLVLTSIYLHKHRAAGGHCTPARAGSAPNTAPAVGTAVPVQYSENKQDIELGQQQPQQHHAPSAPVYQQPTPQYPSPSPTPVNYPQQQQQQYPVYEVPTTQQQLQH